MPTKTIEVTELALAIEAKLSEPGVTLRGAAEAIGVSPTTIMNWADGKPIMFSLERQHAIARFLGVTPPQVLEMAGLQVTVDPGPDHDAAARLDASATPDTFRDAPSEPVRVSAIGAPISAYGNAA